MKATKRLIDSVWTLEYNIVSDTEIEVIKFSRNDPEGYEKEYELPQCSIIEGDRRVMTNVLIRDNFKAFDWVDKDNCDREYKVINPKYVFDYGA